MPEEKARKNFIQEFGKWALVFLAFGFIGWVYEVAIMYFEMHQGFVNRGFLLTLSAALWLWGPYHHRRRRQVSKAPSPVFFGDLPFDHGD